MLYSIFSNVIAFVFLWVLSIKRIFILRKFPQTPANFFFGHALQLRSTTDILNAFSKFTAHAPTVRVRVGLVVGLVTADYKFAEFILNKSHNLKKSENYAFLLPWLGSGLLLSDGDKWKRNRKIITPAFHFEILKKFVSVFESVGDILVDKLTKHDGSSNVDLYPLVTLCTLDIISETAMGTKINAQNGENAEYVNGVREMCRITTDRCLSPIKVLDGLFALTADCRLQEKLLKDLHGLTLNVIDSRKTKKCVDGEEEGKKMALLDLLLKFSDEGQSLSYQNIREEVDTFMFAGHDTTASGICFTLYCLAAHPQVQDKVVQEQNELFGNDKNPEITYDELQNMKYLELVIKETMRLYPPVPIVGRLTTEDMEFDGVTIPKYTNIAVFIYGLHRNPEYFPDPETFDPERFAQVDDSFSHAYLPFSTGPRNCIGQKFAMLEMKSVISKIVRHFEVHAANPRHNLQLAAETVLKSLSGVKVGLKKRV